MKIPSIIVLAIFLCSCELAAPFVINEIAEAPTFSGRHKKPMVDSIELHKNPAIGDYSIYESKDKKIEWTYRIEDVSESEIKVRSIWKYKCGFLCEDVVEESLISTNRDGKVLSSKFNYGKLYGLKEQPVAKPGEIGSREALSYETIHPNVIVETDVGNFSVNESVYYVIRSEAKNISESHNVINGLLSNDLPFKNVRFTYSNTNQDGWILKTLNTANTALLASSGTAGTNILLASEAIAAIDNPDRLLSLAVGKLEDAFISYVPDPVLAEKILALKTERPEQVLLNVLEHLNPDFLNSSLPDEVKNYLYNEDVVNSDRALRLALESIGDNFIDSSVNPFFASTIVNLKDRQVEEILSHVIDGINSDLVRSVATPETINILSGQKAFEAENFINNVFSMENVYKNFINSIDDVSFLEGSAKDGLANLLLNSNSTPAEETLISLIDSINRDFISENTSPGVYEAIVDGKVSDPEKLLKDLLDKIDREFIEASSNPEVALIIAALRDDNPEKSILHIINNINSSYIQSRLPKEVSEILSSADFANLDGLFSSQTSEAKTGENVAPQAFSGETFIVEYSLREYGFGEKTDR